MSRQERVADNTMREEGAENGRQASGNMPQKGGVDNLARVGGRQLDKKWGVDKRCKRAAEDTMRGGGTTRGDQMTDNMMRGGASKASEQLTKQQEVGLDDVGKGGDGSGESNGVRSGELVVGGGAGGQKRIWKDGYEHKRINKFCFAKSIFGSIFFHQVFFC